MLPDGEVTIFGFFWMGERPLNVGELSSVGVGGVFTIEGAAFAAVVGGVCGRSLEVVMVGIRSFGLSGCCGLAALSGKIAPILAATLPLLFVVSPSCCLAACTGLGNGLRSGLPPGFGFGLVLLRTKAPFSLSTGEVGRRPPTSTGAWREATLYFCTSVSPTLSCEVLGTAEAAEAMSSTSMWLADLTSGEEVVR